MMGQRPLRMNFRRKDLRSTKSRNDVLILFEASDLARAKAFCASADLRAAMKKAGVTGKPDLSILAGA